jgi:hypothetical protein
MNIVVELCLLAALTIYLLGAITIWFFCNYRAKKMIRKDLETWCLTGMVKRNEYSQYCQISAKNITQWFKDNYYKKYCRLYDLNIFGAIFIWPIVISIMSVEIIIDNTKPFIKNKMHRNKFFNDIQKEVDNNSVVKDIIK